MLDVLHVYYERDITPRFEGEIEVKDKIRRQLYELLYEQRYSYGGPSEKEPVTDESPDLPPDLPPDQHPLKPFVPATNPDDFSTVLREAPLGG